jgi:hypothetical protein
MNNGRKMKIFFGILIPAPKRSAEASGEGEGPKFQDLRAMSMTRNERIRLAIPHQGTRPLSSIGRFFLPRGNKITNELRREKTRTGRIRHGIARAFEDLRGVRLSLVPRPDPGECLLQGM